MIEEINKEKEADGGYKRDEENKGDSGGYANIKGLDKKNMPKVGDVIYIEKESVEWLYTQHFFFFYKEEPNP